MMNVIPTKNTILWADDDLDDLEMFREVIKAHAPHHQLIEFSNGFDLLNYLQGLESHNYPCLIVLDMNMPLLNGKETLFKIKNDPKLRDIPVAIFSTSISPVDKVDFSRYRVEMIAKPPNYDLLKARVQSLVELCKN